MIDFSLTDAQREVQRTARAFAEREILPRIHELDATATYDRRSTRRWAPPVCLACRSPSATAGPAWTTSPSPCCARRWSGRTPPSG